MKGKAKKVFLTIVDLTIAVSFVCTVIFWFVIPSVFGFFSGCLFGLLGTLRLVSAFSDMPQSNSYHDHTAGGATLYDDD